MPLPALLTIQSGINQLRYATLKGIMAAKKKEIAKVARRAGRARDRRSCAVCAAEVEADGDDRRIAAEAREGTGQAASRRGAGPMILVIAEQKDGKLNRASVETIAARSSCRCRSRSRWPARTSVGGGELAQYGEVIAVDHAALAHYTPDAFVQALQQVITQVAGDRDAAAHLSDPRLLADAGDAPRSRARHRRDRREGQRARRRFAADVPGQADGGCAAAGPAPHFVTIQIGAFRADAATKGAAAAPIASASVTIDESKLRQKPDAPFQEAKQAVDLSQAERIVAVGRGIKSQENIAVAEQLAKAFGAELAASRPICDNGWLPMERQIGSSGQTVAPKLYVALGISGAIQHLVGMKGSRTIVAINKDAEAPIFEVADYGIQGDLFELAPALIAELQK
jgi:electron transfer flavoprotein alpha subunit